ncbi:zinc finger protein 33B-like [Lutzomyia longipalpis]|uniref:zinc finger protein 33B-like n=1 Tax=Lutzomyia longipalpis TaxID=7200 RepID=UPI00248421C4|nr:zinc finger protein 33B-like [Lutzomyia longipalpis]
MIPFFNLYYELMGIELPEYSDFPSKICSFCETRMIQSYQFREQCLETEDKLKELVNEKAEITAANIFISDMASSTIDEKASEETLIDTVSYDVEVTKDDIDPQNEFKKPQDEPPQKKIIKVSQKQMRELQTRVIQCSRCSELFKGIQLFRQHTCKIQAKVKEIQEIEEVKPKLRRKAKKFRKECEKCGKVFTGHTSYLCHMDNHNGVKRYSCLQCNKKFSHWISRRTHMYRDHYKKFYCMCPQCGHGFYSQSRLNIHIATKHGNLVFQCETCGKTFASKRTLAHHLITHGESKKCKDCGKILKNYNTLKHHMRGHLKERNYICPVCSNKFTCNHALKSHVRNLHPDQVNLLPPDGTIVNKKYLKRMEQSNRQDS